MHAVGIQQKRQFTTYNRDAAEGSSAVASMLNLDHLERQQSANQLRSIMKSMTALTSVFQWNKNNFSEELTVIIIN